jgi:hypothetical protein
LQVSQQTKQGHYVVEVWLLDVKAITSVVMQLDFDNPQTARGKKRRSCSPDLSVT